MKGFLLAILTLLSFNFSASAQECLTGNCRDGYGTYVTEKGTKYIGQFENFESSGQGVCFFKNGDVYAGTWKNGKFHGEGRLTYSDGSIKAGLWENSQFVEEVGAGCLSGDCEDGYGIYLFENGAKYLGDFKNGQTDGLATTFYADGSKFIGSLTTGKRHGQGVLYKGDGTVEEGIWNQNVFVGSSREAKGCVDGNCKNGPGVYVYKDNTRYEGTFKNSLAHGQGTCFYSDGDRYEGEWRSHTFDGQGTMFLSDGRVMTGLWRAGEFVGEMEEVKTVTTAPTQKATPKVWALLVGVARYNHMKSLKFTDDDAYRMYAFLKSPEGGALADENISILIDEDATKDNILENMDDIFGKAGSNDIVLFYFSGHGLKGSFLPGDYDGEDNKLFHSEIVNRLSNCNAKGKIVIADACHSGSLENGMYAAKGEEGSVQNIIESYYKAFDASRGGTALLLSSKAEETSIENNGLRQGIFSHFLIRGLKGAADHDNDKLVTVEELFKYIEANVKYYTNNYQTPIITGDYDEKMPLGVVR